MKKNILLIILLLAFNNLKAIFPINFFYPDDHPFRLLRQDDRDWQISCYGEGSLDVSGRNLQSRETNILQIWDYSQDALSMIRGFPEDSPIGQFSLPFNTISDDGTRGHLCFKADSKMGGIFPIFRWYLPKDLTLSLTTPFYWVKIKDVCIQDMTESNTFGDLLVKDQIIDNLPSILETYGNGLKIGPWERFGPGDFWLEVDWIKNFEQPKRQNLTNVLLNIRGGLTLPTGLAQNIDEMFSIPFGNDHSLGIVFGGEVQMTMWDIFKIGIDAEFWQLFGTSRCYRVKTDISQTDFLLLAKTKARKRWGFTQRYDLWLEIMLCKGLSVEGWYQHIKHNKDKYSFFDPQYIESIANSAGRMQGWSMHNFIALAKYSGVDYFVDNCFVPQISIFYRKPFNGCGTIQSTNIGASLALEF